MLANYDRTDTPLRDLYRALSRARKYARHGLNDHELTADIARLTEAIQTYRGRVMRRQPEEKIIDFIERAEPLVAEVEKRDGCFTSHALAKLLE